MNRRHARPMSAYRRERAIRAAATMAVEAVVLVACMVSIYLFIWTLGG